MDRENIKIGDTAIVQSSYTIDCRQVERVTSALVFFSGTEWPRQARIGQIIFSGGDALVRRLHEQLISSSAQLNEDTRNACLRKQRRDIDFIQAATVKAAEQ